MYKSPLRWFQGLWSWVSNCLGERIVICIQRNRRKYTKKGPVPWVLKKRELDLVEVASQPNGKKVAFPEGLWKLWRESFCWLSNKEGRFQGWKCEPKQRHRILIHVWEVTFEQGPGLCIEDRIRETGERKIRNPLSISLRSAWRLWNHEAVGRPWRILRSELIKLGFKRINMPCCKPWVRRSHREAQ